MLAGLAGPVQQHRFEFHEAAIVRTFQGLVGRDAVRFRGGAAVDFAEDGVFEARGVIAARRKAEHFHPVAHRERPGLAGFNQQAFGGVLEVECRVVGAGGDGAGAQFEHSCLRGTVGEHDFSAFRGQGCTAKCPVRRIDRAEIEEFAPSVQCIRVSGSGFLRHMVRNIVGTVVDAGKGKIPAGRVAEILAARDRTAAGLNAPPHGLFLWRVAY